MLEGSGGSKAKDSQRVWVFMNKVHVMQIEVAKVPKQTYYKLKTQYNNDRFSAVG